MGKGDVIIARGRVMHDRRLAIVAALTAFTWALAWGGAASANNAPASDDSIREMLAVIDAHKLIDGLKMQVDAMVAASIKTTLRGKEMTPEVKAVMNRMQVKMQAVAGEMLDWNSLVPIYLHTYRASFSQDEMDSIIAFYKTPGGQALIRKMPLVMQNVMTEIQALTQPLQKKFQQIQREALEELKVLPPPTG
jgi:hypothetical protein